MKKVMVAIVVAMATVMSATPAMADFGERPDWPAYYSDEIGTYVYYDDEEAQFYYYDEALEDYVIIIDDEEDDDDHVPNENEEAANFGEWPDWPAYYDNEIGTYVYYDDEDGRFYYYDEVLEDYVTIIDDEEDDDGEMYNSEFPDLYQDEYQASSYGYARVNSQAEFFDLDGNNSFVIPEGEYVLLLQSVGAGGDMTHIMYDDCEGYVYTTCLLADVEQLTYDELFQSGGYMVPLLVDANLRNEDGEVIATIPAGIGVEVISMDNSTGRVWVRWNGRFGSVTAGAIYRDEAEAEQTSSNDVNEDETVNYDDSVEVPDHCGTATIQTKVGANLRGSDNKLIVAIPQGEEVYLLERLNYGGRTKIQWGKYVGTVLTRCLIEDSSETTTASSCNCNCSNCSCNK